MPAVSEAKQRREQELHELEARHKRVETTTEVANCLRYCISGNSFEPADAWKQDPDLEFTEEQKRALRDKLYNTLMGL